MLLWKDRRLRLSLTGLGLQYLLAMLAVGLFAANTGNNLLYLVFGLMLGLFLVSGAASRNAIRGLRVGEVEPGNLFARVRGGIRLRLEDARPRTLRGLELHLELQDGQAEATFLPGAQGEPAPVVVVHTRVEHRGWTRLKGLRLSTAFPFGFLEKEWFLPLEDPLLVLPHPRSPGTLALQMGEEGFSLKAREGPSSPDGARPLLPGDPPARVHWKRTAQRSLPMDLKPWVRTFQDDEAEGLHLELDLFQWEPGRPFEKELERLSGAILQARLQKRAVRLDVLGPEGRQRFEEPTPCWRALAVAEGAKGLLGLES